MAQKTYTVNWLLQGVGKKDLNEGDTVKLEEADAADLLKVGVLTEVKAEPEKTDKKAEA